MKIAGDEGYFTTINGIDLKYYSKQYCELWLSDPLDENGFRPLADIRLAGDKCLRMALDIINTLSPIKQPSNEKIN